MSWDAGRGIKYSRKNEERVTTRSTIKVVIRVSLIGIKISHFVLLRVLGFLFTTSSATNGAAEGGGGGARNEGRDH